MIDWSLIIPDEELITMYQSYGLERIGQHLGVDKGAVKKRLKSLGVPLRSKGVHAPTAPPLARQRRWDK